MPIRSSISIIHGLAWTMIFTGLGAIAVATFVFVVEAAEWLTSSEWPGLTLADGLGLFGVEHEGPETERQRLLDVAMAAPLSLALYLVGLFTFLTGINIGDFGTRMGFEAQFLSDD